MASKGDESTTPKEVSKEVEVDITTPATESHHASSDILQAISSMKANLDQTNQILATLMAERKRPPTWLPDGDHPSFKRSMTEHDLESVASKNVGVVAVVVACKLVGEDMMTSSPLPLKKILLDLSIRHD